MSQKFGTYYIGRVQKLGILDEDLLVSAIKNPTTILRRGKLWTFINITSENSNGVNYIFGRLSKYNPKGEVPVVDETSRTEKLRPEPNLLLASSPFIYIPEHSGIAFLNVPGHIEVQTFISRFSEIIEKTHQGFFVDCDIELIADLKTFAAKIEALDGIFKIEAKVSPPNPLFSPLWQSLETYLRERNTDRMTIVEDAPESQSLKTELKDLVRKASAQTEDAPFKPEKTIAVGDAAILMAADGYGSGFITGRHLEKTVIIKTSETSLNFAFHKVPNPKDFYDKAFEMLQKIKEQRHMEHGE